MTNLTWTEDANGGHSARGRQHRYHIIANRDTEHPWLVLTPNRHPSKAPSLAAAKKLAQQREQETDQ
jgi:hypothetical protein